MFFFLEKTSFSKLWNSLNYIVFTNILTSVPFPHPSDREWPWVLWVLAGEMLLINALHSLIAIAFRHRRHQFWHEKPFSLISILNTFSKIIICEGVSNWLPYHLNLINMAKGTKDRDKNKYSTAAGHCHQAWSLCCLELSDQGNECLKTTEKNQRITSNGILFCSPRGKKI